MTQCCLEIWSASENLPVERPKKRTKGGHSLEQSPFVRVWSSLRHQTHIRVRERDYFQGFGKMKRTEVEWVNVNQRS